MTTYENLRAARRGPIVSIAAYLLLTIAKLLAGHFLNSSSLIADGFNNLSDILGNVALLIGLHLASQPADADHRFGHWKIEDLSSLVTSFIMFVVGFQVLIQTVRKIFLREETVVDPLGATVGVLSAIVMCGVYFYNKRLAKKLKSKCSDCCCQGQSLRCCNFYWYLNRYRCSILQPDDYRLYYCHYHYLLHPKDSL